MGTWLAMPHDHERTANIALDFSLGEIDRTNGELHARPTNKVDLKIERETKKKERLKRKKKKCEMKRKHNSSKFHSTATSYFIFNQKHTEFVCVLHRAIPERRRRYDTSM